MIEKKIEKEMINLEEGIEEVVLEGEEGRDWEDLVDIIILMSVMMIINKIEEGTMRITLNEDLLDIEEVEEEAMKEIVVLKEERVLEEER